VEADPVKTAPVPDDLVTAFIADAKRRHRQHVSVNFPAPGLCVSRCAGPWPCTAYRAAAAIETALEHHRPEQLHDYVTDPFTGKVKCPHDGDYDGDAHYEGLHGEWYCQSLPTVVVCAACCDPADPDLRAAWPCATYAGILAALTGKEAS
jgi:hypothetical protein